MYMDALTCIYTCMCKICLEMSLMAFCSSFFLGGEVSYTVVEPLINLQPPSWGLLKAALYCHGTPSVSI